jgi:hypothetical protein
VYVPSLLNTVYDTTSTLLAVGVIEPPAQLTVELAPFICRLLVGAYGEEFWVRTNITEVAYPVARKKLVSDGVKLAVTESTLNICPNEQSKVNTPLALEYSSYDSSILSNVRTLSILMVLALIVTPPVLVIPK